MPMLFNTIYLTRNQGHGNARRVALNACSYDLVALMDADDIAWEQRFEVQLRRFMEDSNIDVVGGQISEFVGSSSNVIARRIVPQYHHEIVCFLRRRCPFNQMSVMFRKIAYTKAGGYLDWYCNEDYYLWVRMLLAGCIFANVPETLVKVRVGSEMSARRGGWRYFMSEARLQRYMFRHRVISFPIYIYNILLRFGGEVLMPNALRMLLFRLFRAKPEENTSNSIKYQMKSVVEYPPFSVAICVYLKDNPEHFDRALQSIINQTVKPQEIILVIDGPISRDLQSIIDKYIVICQNFE